MCKLDSSLLQADGGIPLLGEDGVLLPEHTPQLVGAAAGEDGEAGVVDAPPKGGMSFSPQGTAAWLGLFDPVRVSTTPTRITADSRRILYVVDSSVGAKSIDLTDEAETLRLLPGFSFAFKRNGGSNVGFDLSATTDTIDGDTSLVLGSDGDFAVVVYLGAGKWTALVGTAGGSTTPAGTFLGRYVYTSGTGATHTPNAAATLCRITLVGAGGGGGGADSSAPGQAGAGGGGASGGVIYHDWPVSGNITYTVPSAGGAGGAAGNNAGTAGADSTCTGSGLTLTAKGAPGGASMSSGSTFAQAAAGITAVNPDPGDVSVDAGAGSDGRRLNGSLCWGGDGASGPFGGGGSGSGGGAAGVPASGYGAGGGGASALSSTGRAGGDGSGGLLIIEEYT